MHAFSVAHRLDCTRDRLLGSVLVARGTADHLPWSSWPESGGRDRDAQTALGAAYDHRRTPLISALPLRRAWLALWGCDGCDTCDGFWRGCEAMAAYAG